MAAVSGVSRLCLSVSFRGIKHKAQLVKQTLPKVSLSPPFRSFTCVATATKEEDTKPAEAHSRWRIAAGVCVLRMPTLSKQKDQLTVDFEELQDQVWLEKSKLSDFELEELELERLREAKLQKALEDERPESEGIDEADELREMVEARETELKEFEPAPRETEADRSGDMRTHHRKLDRVLYLLVKKPREKHAWQMPQGGIDADESLLECAKRELQEECGDSLDVRFYSPAPHAVYTYSHPPLSQSNPKQSGSKVFFLKAYCCGNCEVKLNKDELVDYAWVTKEEMKHYVSDSYYDVVKKILTE